MKTAKMKKSKRKKSPSKPQKWAWKEKTRSKKDVSQQPVQPGLRILARIIARETVKSHTPDNKKLVSTV